MKELVFRAVQSTGLDHASIARRLRCINSRHAEISAVLSHKKDATTSPRLLRLLGELANVLCMAEEDGGVPLFSGRVNVPPWAFDSAGEHYKALFHLVKIIRPKLIVEIGTFTGLSAVVLSDAMREDCSLVTFDVIAWDSFKDSVLRATDFSNRFRQVLCDLGDFDSLRKHRDLLSHADFIFVDACKDGVFERELLNNLHRSQVLKDGTIILFDDIRQWNMLQIWHELLMPKQDITSVGHFTGSGLVEWRSNHACF